MSPADQVGGSAPTPELVVVKGNPTDEEVAALLVVLAARARPAAEPAPPVETSGWSAYARAVRTPRQPGPGAWRMSGRG